MNPYLRKLLVGFAGLCAITFSSASLADRGKFEAEQSACLKGDQSACTDVGIRMTDGNGIPKDEAGGAQVFRKTCVQNDARACMLWGYALEYGRGVDMNLPEARKAYEVGCKGGNALGCNNLGVMYQAAKGGPRGEAMAKFFYGKACELGAGLGCRNLGVLHADAVTLPQNRTYAVISFDKACQLGDMDGCNKQAWHVEQGLGTERNIEQARVLYAKACDAQYALACQNGKLLAANYPAAMTQAKQAVAPSSIPSSGAGAPGFSVCSAFMNESRKMFFTQPFSAVEIRSRELALAYAQMLREEGYAAASMYAPPGSPPPELTVDCRWHATQDSAGTFKNKLVDGSARDRWTSVPTSFNPK